MLKDQFAAPRSGAFWRNAQPRAAAKMHVSRGEDPCTGAARRPFPLYPDHLHDLNTTMCSIVNKTVRFAIATVSECDTASPETEKYLRNILMNMFRDFFIPPVLVFRCHWCGFSFTTHLSSAFWENEFCVSKLWTHWGQKAGSTSLWWRWNLTRYLHRKFLMLLT